MKCTLITEDKIKDIIQKIIKVGVSLDGSWEEGDYEIEINAFIGSLLIDVPGGHDDPYLIKNAIEENASKIFDGCDGDHDVCYIEVLLVESGEWQDVSWCKWYDVQKIVMHKI